MKSLFDDLLVFPVKQLEIDAVASWPEAGDDWDEEDEDEDYDDDFYWEAEGGGEHEAADVGNYSRVPLCNIVQYNMVL